MGEGPCKRAFEGRLLAGESLLFCAGMLLVHFSRSRVLTPEVACVILPLIVSLWATHVLLRRTGSRTDETLLPLLGLLCITGQIEVFRLEEGLAIKQALFLSAGFVLFNLWYLRGFDYRIWEDYKYLALLAGIILQVLVMFLGSEINGAKLWFRVGEFSFQPVEIVKILLVIFLASYLKQKKEFIVSQPRKLFNRLSLKYLFPLLVTWGCCETVLVVQRDLGMALLLFSTFMCLFYVATKRTGIILAGFFLFICSSWFIVHAFPHVHVRVTSWLDPWRDPQGSSYQILQALFSISAGGLWGTGLGLGSPELIPAVTTDFIFASIAEELGFLGALAIIGIYLMMFQRIFRVALKAHDEFGILLASGLGSLLACQTFIILGGTTKYIPMTGITLPFVSYGGSSILANFFLFALIYQIAEQAARKSASPDLP